MRKRTTVSSVQSSYIAMGPKMADKADPSQELSVNMGQDTAAGLSGGKVLFSLDFRSSRLLFDLVDSLLLRDVSATGGAAVPSKTILGEALPALMVNVKALGGGLEGVLEAFHRVE